MKALWLIILLGIIMLVTDDVLTRHQRDQFQSLSHEATDKLKLANDELAKEQVRTQQVLTLTTNVTEMVDRWREMLAWRRLANGEFEWLEGKIQKLDHRLAMDENALNIETNRYESFSK